MLSPPPFDLLTPSRDAQHPAGYYLVLPAMHYPTSALPCEWWLFLSAEGRVFPQSFTQPPAFHCAAEVCSGIHSCLHTGRLLSAPPRSSGLVGECVVPYLRSVRAGYPPPPTPGMPEPGVSNFLTRRQDTVIYKVHTSKPLNS